MNSTFHITEYDNSVPAALVLRQADPSLNNGKKEVVFIDTGVADSQTLVNEVKAGVEVVLLDGSHDGLAQMVEWAQGKSGYDAIHVLSHGAEGQVRLGTATLDDAALTARAQELATLGATLSEEGDLLIYGCHVAAGQVGVDFVQRLAQASGADVAASEDLTGAVALGGDWVMERNVGPIESNALTLAGYDHVLAASTITFSSETNNGDNIATDGKFGSGDIPGLEIQFTATNVSGVATDWGYSSDISSLYPYTSGGNNAGGSQLIKIASSSTATNFNFQGIKFYSINANGTIKIEGFDNGGSTGSITYQVPNGDENYTLSSTALTPSIFQSVDEVRITQTALMPVDGAANNYVMYLGINNIIVDTVSAAAGPTVSGVAISSATGIQNSTLNAGDVVSVTVTMSEATTVTGTPQLALNIGGTTVQASYASGTGTTALVFNYTILAGQTDANGISINANSLALNGGTLKNASSNDATLTHSAETDNGSYKVDTTAPSAPSAPDMTAGTDSGSSNTDNITSDTTPTFTGTAEADSTVTLYDTDGSTSLGSTTATGGNWSITASTLSAGTHTVTAKATDAAGNVSVASGGLPLTIDTAAPTVTAAKLSISGASGTGGAYKIGDTITATWDNTGGGDNNSDITGGVTFNFSQFGGGAAVAATNSAGIWTATYTIVAGTINGTTNHNVSATATDNAGNTTTTADTSNATVDNVAPTQTNSTMSFSADTGSSSTDFITKTAAQTISGTLSGVTTTGDIVQVSLDNGSTWTTASNTVGQNTWSLAGQTLTASNTLKARVTDAAGNTGTAATQAYVLDTTAPSITAAGIPNTTMKVGATVTATITVADDGGSTYTLGSSTIGGFTLGSLARTNSTTYTAQFTVTEGGTDVAAGSDIPVSLVLTDPAGNSNTAYTTAIGQAGDAINAHSPTDIALSNNSVATIAGTNAVVGALSSTDATTGETFTYTLVAGAGDTNNGLFNIDSGNLRANNASGLTAGNSYSVRVRTTDAAGNTYEEAVTVSAVVGPAIASATYNASTGVLSVTGSLMEAKTGAANDIAVNKLTLTGEGGTTYTLTSSDVEITSATAFSVTLNATDHAAVNQILNKNGTTSTSGTNFNLAAADDWNSNVTTGDTVDASNTVTVSNATVPAISGATYDASTGALVLTGTGFLALSGVTNDIVANKFTFTGEGGTTYTLTNTANVEITSGTAATLTLSATDKAAVNQIVNKNGTSATSGTTYNIAAAEDWAAGSDAAVVVADLTGNGITVSNVAVPTLTSATYDASTGALVLTGTGFLTLSGATNDIVANKFTFTGEGGATYTLTDTANVEITSSTAATLTLSATDKAAINQIVNKNGTSSTGGITYNIAAAEDWAAGAAAGVTDVDATGNGITASNVAVPTITSATYDGATGQLVVTGTGFLKLSGATNDIDISKLSIAGDSTSYTLTSSSVEITSGTSFTVTLNSTDINALKTRLNKDGTSSQGSTTYNLAAAEDWAAGADAAVVVADLTGNGITTTNVSTSITSATYDASTGVLSVTGANLANGGAVDVTKLSVTGQDGANYTLAGSYTVTASSSTAFSVTLDATDKINVNGLLNKNGASAVGATTFNLAAAASWMSGAAADLSGNAVTVSNVTAPTLTSATYDASIGVLVVTGTGLVKASGASNDITANKLTLTGEGGATYTLTDTANVELTSGTSFSLTLSATDSAAINQIINKNGTSSTGGTTFNLAAADDWNTVIANADISDTTGNGITVSNVAVPTLISATYDASTGALVLTGTGFLTLSGATNDIVADKFTFTGEGGTTYTLTDTANVEITSSTAATLTLSATDKAAINQIVNKNGTSSTGGTTYNIAAAEDWAAGAAAGVTDVDATGNGITASNVAVPTITSATYDGATGQLVVTGTGFLKLSGATNDIDISKLSIAGDSTSYTLTSSSVEITSGTSFTVTLNSTDINALKTRLNKDGTSSQGSTTYNLAAAEDWAAGADAAVVVADLTGNGITATLNAAPIITSNGGGETAAINVAENGTAVTTVTATDANSDTVTFSITGGADQAKFSINANTGVLSFTAAPNFEAPTDADTNNSYIVAVTANDGNGGTDVQTITVNVTDVNETPAPAPDPAPTPVQTAPVTSEALETIPLTGTQTTTTTTQTDPSTGAPQTVATNNFVGTATVDGMAVNGVTTTQTITTTNPGTGQTSTVTVQNSTLTVPIVPNNRTEEDKVSTNADIPLAQAANGERLIQASLPVGVGLTAEGVNDPRLTLRELLINAAEPRSDASSFTDIQNQIDNFVPGVNDQSQVTVRTLTFQSNPNNPTPRNEPIVITGANGTGESDVNHPNRQEALVIDVRNLPAGTKLILDNVEFAIIIGATRVTGGNGKNVAVGDNAAQYMVLGADDDVLHGGGGDDIIGSRGGDDLINGDAGNDWLVGGVGNDTLNGGEGNDLLHGGASDAGTYRFTLNETGKVRLDWTATHAEMAVLPAGTIDGQWWHADGQAQIIDPRFAFVTADAAFLQDVAMLYQAVLKQLPNVADLNAWVASGKTQTELVQIAWDAYQSLQGPGAQALEVQLAQLIQSVWGGTADPALIQAGVSHINQGGSWGDALLYLARHANNTQAITDAQGRIKLAKDWTLKETGWSGEGGNDQLFGGAGNDVLVAGSGNNVLDGGVGTDLAVFFGQVNEWQIAVNDAQQIVVSHRYNGGQNVIRDIELLQFGDTIFGQIKPDHPVVVTGVQYAITDVFTSATPEQVAMIGISDWTTA